MTWIVLAVAAGAFAVADWIAVWRGIDRWRPLTKSAVMVLLIAAAVARGPLAALHLPGDYSTTGAVDIRVSVTGPHPLAVFALVLTAAVLSLVGDVLLLPQVDGFVGGLASFLLAHLAYIAAFTAVGVAVPLVAIDLFIVLLFLDLVALRIVRSVRATEPALVAPVVVYIAVISIMAAAAIATRSVLPAAGALVFVASDAQLAWNRFVAPRRILDLGCIVTYHVAQGLLVLSLA